MRAFTSVLTIALIAFIGFSGCDSVDAGSEAGIESASSTSDAVESEALGKKGGDPKWDGDDNGYPDAGIYVNGNYTALYAYDANGDYYFDLGDGRIQGTVGSVDDLEHATLTTCDYVVNYRGDFGNDPSLNAGWIQNHINCSGFDDDAKYNYTIVHETDPRYTGNPDWAIWNTWEYQVYTVSGSGNLVLSNPQSHVGS